MCEYCEIGKRLPDVDDTDLHDSSYVFVDDDDNELSVAIENVNYATGEMDELYINIPIHYCPMCGRKLGE